MAHGVARLPGRTRRQALRSAVVVGVGAIACGGPAPGGAPAAVSRLGPQGFTFKQPVLLTYWKSLEGPRHDAQVKLTDDFNARRTDVRVSLDHVGAYAAAAQKLTASLAANTPPDVMLLTVDQHMPAFARQGALFALDDFVRADKSASFDKYVPGFIKNGTINGKLYQIPFARSTPLLYFNRDQLKAAGLPETAPSTYDQLLEISQKLVRASVTQPDSNDGQRLAAPAAAYWWTFQSTAWAFGGRYSDDKFNSTVAQPETVAAMQFLADLVHRHRAGRAYRTSGASQTAFLQGQVAFLMVSTANLTQIEQGAAFRLGAAFMPSQKQRAVPGGGSGLCIMEAIAREKKEASWEFVKFMTTSPNTAFWSQATGYMVVRTDAATLPDYQRYLQASPNAKVTFDQMQYVRTQDSIVEVPQATPMIEAAMRQVLSEQVPAKTAFEELQRQLTVLAQGVRR